MARRLRVDEAPVWIVWAISYDYDRHDDLVSIHRSRETALAAAVKLPATPWTERDGTRHDAPVEGEDGIVSFEGQNDGWVVAPHAVKP